MIPKIIHYCWFGGNEKPEIIQKCIASWREHCPDWQIMEWNESNYDVAKNPYVRKAYQSEKWAFVSDFVRLDVLYEIGGVYLDTDVEILCDNPFDQYLLYQGVLAFDTARSIASGLIYISEPRARLTARFMDTYLLDESQDHFRINSVMNKPVIQKEFPELKWNDHSQTIRNQYFMSTSEYSRLMKHYGTRSWCDDLPDYKVSGDMWLKRVLRNPAIFEKLEGNSIGKKVLPLYTFVSYDLLDLGPLFYIKRMYLKVKNRK